MCEGRNGGDRGKRCKIKGKEKKKQQRHSVREEGSGVHPVSCIQLL